MATATANPYELAGRLTKAHKLASHLHRHGITSAEAPQIGAAQWMELAKLVGIKPPSDETIRLTIKQLGDFEKILTEPDWDRISA